MKLLPAETWLHVYDRPALNSRVAIVDPDHADHEWAFYLRLRLRDYDLATTASIVPLAVLNTTLIIRDAGLVLRYPVRLDPLTAPLAAWRLSYTGEPEQQELRREWRNDQESFPGWIQSPEATTDTWTPTVSYDFSLSAIRFFVPWRLPLHTHLAVRWQLDNDRVEGSLEIVRQDPTSLWWNKQQGYSTVGQWGQLTDPMRYRWRTYCWRHQPATLARR